jgi:cyclophilin family peptidyl-prolyl cis-trans isomerase
VSKASKRERQRQNREARREFEEQVHRRRRRMRSLRNFAFLLIPVLILGAVLALTNSGSDSSSSSTKIVRSYKAAPPMTIDPTKTYTATMETSQGTIEIALDAATAPTSVNNFVFLAKNRFYDGLQFVRAATPINIIQAGSPDNTQSGGPGYTVQAEVPKTPYTTGSMAWAKSAADPDGTAGSQFFIGTGPGVATLPLQYGIIGTVTKGLDVAQKIEGFAPSSGDGPLTTKVTIKKVTIAESGGATTTTTAPATSSSAP